MQFFFVGLQPEMRSRIMMNLTIKKNTKGPREVLLDMGEKFLRLSILERTTIEDSLRKRIENGYML